MGLYEGYFPYANFHMLNFDWILRRLREKELHGEIFNASMLERVAEVSPEASKLTLTFDRAQYEDGARSADQESAELPAASTTAAGVMTAAQVQQLNNASSGISALNGKDIMGAAMLENVTGVSRTGSEVTLNYSRATYTSGGKTAGTSGATIPAATASDAGVMTAAQVRELSAATSKLAGIGDAAGETLSSAVSLINNTNTRILMHDYQDGYWVLTGGIAFEVVVPASVSDTVQVDLAASISSDPEGPGWIGMRSPYFLKAGTYHIALPCSARAYNLSPGGTGVTSNGCIWAYFQDIDNAGVTVRVLPNFTSQTGNKTTIEGVRII